ncbi:GntR family transcriptional regulator [Amycolatopsis sp. PS_44_ISF1]|uniref:GntR family transcriptional regulator n=1 Tax=Amycolatopsis sp. PS_44_ISF1 TaxID=2974917 RepID=UPI0028DEB684|nr:GntR family transcriptional regulator [Amycolatopsis sp. PS_44_ISF1]MDT8913705.1 GntR family transcriptional regulator [Amycolatopsis sp. PS_44_ISF1]
MPSQRYRTLAAELATGIHRGDHPPGTRLPTLRMLAISHGVARATARAAVKILEDDGLVTVRHGHGITVRFRECLPAPPPAPVRRVSTSNDGTVTVLAGWARPDRDITTRLGMQDGTLVAHRIHHHRRRGILVRIDEHWIPGRMIDHVRLTTGHDLTDAADTSTPEVLAVLHRSGVAATVATLQVESRRASAHESELMGLATGTPIASAYMTTHDTSGTPINVCMTVSVEPIKAVTIAAIDGAEPDW